MKCKLLTLLTCFHALSPTASTCDMLTNYREAGGSAVLSSSVDTTPRHGLGDVPANASAIIAEFLAGIPIPTDAAGACEVVRLITEGKPFAILRGISAVSREVGECFECTEIRKLLSEAVQKAIPEAIPEAIQILNDDTDGVCDLEDEEFEAGLSRIIQQPCYTSPNDSENAQALTQLARHFESLADAYKLLIKGGCIDPRSTKHKLARALEAASVVLGNAGYSHTSAGNHRDAVESFEEGLALSQRCAEVYYELAKRREGEYALMRAAFNLYFSHTRAGNHAAAAKAHEKHTKILSLLNCPRAVLGFAASFTLGALAWKFGGDNKKPEHTQGHVSGRHNPEPKFIHQTTTTDYDKSQCSSSQYDASRDNNAKHHQQEKPGHTPDPVIDQPQRQQHVNTNHPASDQLHSIAHLLMPLAPALGGVLLGDVVFATAVKLNLINAENTHAMHAFRALGGVVGSMTIGHLGLLPALGYTAITTALVAAKDMMMGALY